MTLSLRQRVFLFCALTALLVSIVAWSVITGWREIGALRHRFTVTQFESFRIAGDLQSSVLSLNAALLAYEISGAPEDWDKFQHDSQELDRWIDQQRDALKTSAERQALEAINGEYDRYLAVARAIRAKETARATPDTVHQLATAARRMLALGSQLAEAHRRALGDLLGASQRSLGLLEGLLGAGFLVLFGVGAGGVRMLFLETIAPLRTQLVEAQALAERHEKLASLGVLAAGVAHEIRNPLTAIKTRVFLLQKKLAPNSTAYEDASLIDREIDRLERIVRDFLLFARPGEPDFTTLTPRMLLHEVCELLTPELARADIALGLEAGEADDLPLRADAQQLQQVLINLIRNAAESIVQRGQVTLRARCSRRPLHGQPQAVLILEVQDTGTGIPAEVQERLFDPFFTTKPTGTGLGLSIAMRIMEKHGGALQFKSEPGSGTIFALVLPRATSEVAVLATA